MARVGSLRAPLWKVFKLGEKLSVNELLALLTPMPEVRQLAWSVLKEKPLTDQQLKQVIEAGNSVGEEAAELLIDRDKSLHVKAFVLDKVNGMRAQLTRDFMANRHAMPDELLLVMRYSASVSRREEAWKRFLALSPSKEHLEYVTLHVPAHREEARKLLHA